MTIELMDMGVPYALQTDITDEGEKFIRIMPQPGNKDRDTDYDICLDEVLVKELIRTLQFLLGEIK